MRGHWLSQTRRLNRHYQSGALTPLEWWRGIIIGGFGPQSIYSSINGLIFRTDGCFVGDVNYGGQLIFNSRSIGSSTFTSFVPFYIMDLSSITINGFTVPDLLQYTLTDSTNKLKVIKTNVTFYWYDVFGVEQHVTRSCYVFGYLPQDMPTIQGGFDDVTITNAKFTDLKWRLPYNAHVKCGVNSADFFAEWQDDVNYDTHLDDASVHFTRDLIDQTVSYGFGAPDIGSGMTFGNTLELNYFNSMFNYYSNNLGVCRFGYVDSNDVVRIESIFQPIGMNEIAHLDHGQMTGYPQMSTQNIKCVANEFTCEYGFMQLSLDTMLVDYVEADVNGVQVVSIS